MDYYYHELEKLQEEFSKVISKYPLFQEMIDKIYDEDIKEINELLEKNDEFYLKQAIQKLKDLINFIKNTSKEIEKEYALFDKMAKDWEAKRFLDVKEDYLDKLNSQVKKANSLINSHDLKKIKEANSIMESVLKEIK